MKIKNSLKALMGRHRDNRMVRRKGRVYIINKKAPRFKARQGRVQIHDLVRFNGLLHTAACRAAFEPTVGVVFELEHAQGEDGALDREGIQALAGCFH